MIWLLAAATAAPLTLQEVLASVDERVPEVASAMASQVEANAKVLAARGYTDPRTSAMAGAYGGKDPRQVAALDVSADTLWGPKVRGGWRMGLGDFPDYDGDRITPQGGELFVSGTLPLLSGLGLSDARVAVLVARAGVDMAEAKLQERTLDVRFAAASAYLDWVAKGEKALVEQTLLEQVESRQQALARQVEEGTRPRLSLLDNERVLLQRRDALARAEQDIQLAALELSLWYRDVDGQPLVPDSTQLPRLEQTSLPLPTLESDEELATARPELRLADALLRAAGTERSAATNRMLPGLNLKTELIRPVDASAEPELFGGAELTIAPMMRRQRGQRAQADATVQRLRALRRAAADRARNDVRAARVRIETALKRVAWTQLAQERATEVVELERRRFALGAGDLFQLLVRESSLAGARKQAVDALLEHELARATRTRALGNLP